MKNSVQENIPLAELTTLGIGGPARYFIQPRSEDGVLEAIEFSRTVGLPLMILGGGSNLLVADEGFPGVVARVLVGGLVETDEGQRVLLRAGSGVEWETVVERAVGRNLSGIECLTGIPGWVGGTPIQNVGAYGQEVSSVISRVRVYDRESDEVREMPAAECGFGYRTSIFNANCRGRYVVLAVEYALQRSGRPRIDYPDLQRLFSDEDAPSLAGVRRAVRQIRASKAMLRVAGDPDARSAGSFFKNPVLDGDAYAGLVEAARRENALPPGGEIPHYSIDGGFTKIPAGWLIEASGYAKGCSDGPVGLSTKHALALVNRGGARAADVLRFAGDILCAVEHRFGIRLLVEPAFAGFSEDIVSRFGAVQA